MPRICPQCHQQFSATMERCPADGTPLESRTQTGAADPMIGRLLAERYRIQRVLGEGGMGRVYLAEHERMGRLSAVKVMGASLASTPEAVSRFNREAANASRIHQPNVAAIYDFGEAADGTLYLAMEYVEGETLTALLKREGPLAPARAAELLAQIADGLHAAHHLDIVHRDLKPDNILVTRHQDGREWVKIVDFGIAKQTKRGDQTVTSLGVAIGTPEYMSPEQIAGETLDARTDLYSLALVLFTMLTGQLPHAAMTSKQSLVKRLTAAPRTLAEVAPHRQWAVRLQKALDRALAPEPDDRYHSVGDFARDVRAAAGGAVATRGSVAPDADGNTTPMPVRARDETVARAPARSRRTGAVLAALLLLGAGGGLAAVDRDSALRTLRDAGLRGRLAVVLRHARSPRSSLDSVAAVSAMPQLPPQVPLLVPSQVPPDVQVQAQAPPALSPMAAGQRLESTARQAARQATGDTANGEPHAAVMQSSEDDTREIMLHVTRAHTFTHSDDLAEAGRELRTAYEEYRIFLSEHAAAPQVDQLRGSLQTAIDDALTACNASRIAELASGGRAFRCEHPARTGVLMVYDAGPNPRRVSSP
jgi:hypothetical protein